MEGLSFQASEREAVAYVEQFIAESGDNLLEIMSIPLKRLFNLQTNSKCLENEYVRSVCHITKMLAECGHPSSSIIFNHCAQDLLNLFIYSMNTTDKQHNLLLTLCLLTKNSEVEHIVETYKAMDFRCLAFKLSSLPLESQSDAEYLLSLPILSQEEVAQRAAEWSQDLLEVSKRFRNRITKDVPERVKMSVGVFNPEEPLHSDSSVISIWDSESSLHGTTSSKTPILLGPEPLSHLSDQVCSKSAGGDSKNLKLLGRKALASCIEMSSLKVDENSKIQFLVKQRPMAARWQSFRTDRQNIPATKRKVEFRPGGSNKWEKKLAELERSASQVSSGASHMDSDFDSD